MGRFNLNQILSDTSKAAAGGGSAKPRPSESRYEKLSVFDLVPSEDNFYSMREIGELKAAIEIAGKVLQNLVVVPLGDGKYKVIAGHRRRLASIELVNDGKPEYEFVPCVIEPTEEAADEQEIRDGLDLIVTNSQREKGPHGTKSKRSAICGRFWRKRRQSPGSSNCCAASSKRRLKTESYRRTGPAILSQRCFIPAQRRSDDMTPSFAICPRNSRRN